MEHKKSKNAVVFGAVFATVALLGTHSAAAQKIKLDSAVSVGVDVKIAVDLLESDMFATLVSTRVAMPAKAEAPLSITAIDTMTTAGLPYARISHDFVPLPEKYYRTNARIGPARAIKDEDVDVRVVYANPIPLRDTINFRRTKD